MLNLHEPIFVHRYTLRSKKPLNALTGRLEHEGALVRIGDGVGALQPWPEFGDLPLERQLRILAQGGFTSHLERLRVCCKLDGAARRQQRSEFRDFVPPPSHVYEPDAARIVKVKCGTDVKKEAARLRDTPAKKLRVDFNGQLSAGDFAQFIEALDAATAARIDFVEDPVNAPQHVWDRLQKRAPFDFASDRHPVPARVRVLKPACDSLRVSGGRVVFTSYMDHPVGQLFAAREAAAFYSANPHLAEVCGLASHGLFEPDEFLERMKTDAEGRLQPVEGTGFGFDDLLEKLPWQRVN